uniref:Peptidase A2 domain-containing protein n=1 Tax=Strongyloides venezuelensis TaxID=75913 RepID=A0A0K0FGY5_STRVS
MRTVDVEAPRKVEENGGYMGFLNDDDLRFLMVKENEVSEKMKIDKSLEDKELSGPTIDVVFKNDEKQYPTKAFIDTGAEKSINIYEYLDKMLNDRLDLKKYENSAKFKVDRDESVETVTVIAPAAQLLVNKKFRYDVLVSQIDARSLGFFLCKSRKVINRKVLKKPNDQLKLGLDYHPMNYSLNNCNQPSTELSQWAGNNALGSSTNYRLNIGNIISSCSKRHENELMLNKEEGNPAKIMTVDNCKNKKMLNKDETVLNRDEKVLSKNVKKLDEDEMRNMLT